MAFSLARAFSNNADNLQLWHQRLGHRNMADVARMIGVSPPSKPCFCAACVESKSVKHPLTGSGIEPLGAAPRPAYLFHTDAMGPFRTSTRSGKRYVLILVDDYSRRCFVFLLKTTAEFFALFKDFVARLEADFGKDKVVAQLRADGVGYYLENSSLRAFCKSKGIYQVFSAPNTPQLNAVSERTNRTLWEMTRAMMIHAGAPPSLWGEAINYAAYVLDRCPRTYNDGDYNTPLARWHQKAQPRAHYPLRVWGCTGYKHVAFDNHDKLQPKAIAHVFIGIDEERKCYRLARLTDYKLTFSAHVTFNEGQFPCKGNQRSAPQTLTLEFDPPRHYQEPAEDLSEPLAQQEAPLRVAPPLAAPPALRRSDRVRLQRQPSPPIGRRAPAAAAAAAQLLHSPAAARDSEAVEAVMSVISQQEGKAAPKNHRQAMSLDNAVAWRAAEIDEYEAHVENETFSPPCHPPPGVRPVPTAIVYKVRRPTAVKDAKREKARIVCRGYRMMPGVDFNETHAPVARFASIRLMCALAAQHDLELNVHDCVTAFLTPSMDTEVYVTLPPAFNNNPDLQANATQSNTVHRLLKGVPGIPQGSRLFNDFFNKIMTDELNFTRLPGDYCIYHKPHQRIYIAIWVDDVLSAHPASEQSYMDSVLATLKKHVRLHHGGAAHDYLAFRIKRDRATKSLSLDQSDAIKALLQKSGMENCHPAATPVATTMVFTKHDCPSDADRADMVEEQAWYRSILASTLYFSICTRPDITFAVSKLCKYMHNPGTEHIRALKRLLRYLKGTHTRCLVYDFSAPPPLSGAYGYYDAAHADDIDTRRSTMAYIFLYEGCAISWATKLHTYVTTSTNHSEYGPMTALSPSSATARGPSP